MFHEGANYYDQIYSFKDYKAESEKLLVFIHNSLRTEGKDLLDVACGTGNHINFLKEHFTAEGLELAPEMVELASKKFPQFKFHEADMIDFDLGKQFDVVTNLFSSIGYVKTIDNLKKCISSMANHVKRGGLLIIEPWIKPEDWKPGTVHMHTVDEPELKIARVNNSQQEGNISLFDLHHLVATPQGVDYFVERHEMGLFETEEILNIMYDIGLEVTFDPNGLTGRGLFVGIKK
jgi:SAM-dependent methyltransferase